MIGPGVMPRYTGCMGAVFWTFLKLAYTIQRDAAGFKKKKEMDAQPDSPLTFLLGQTSCPVHPDGMPMLVGLLLGVWGAVCCSPSVALV